MVDMPSNQTKPKWLNSVLDQTLSGAITPDQSGPGSNVNEGWLVGWFVLSV